MQLGPYRLRTIYETNMQTVYNVGRYKQQRENSDARPFWQYTAVLDERTRPAHAALSGVVFRHDDPIWDRIYPPNGFNCRCRVRTLSQFRLDKEGLKVESSEGALSTQTVDAGVVSNTGEIVQREVTVWSGKDRFGKPVTFRTDPGWNYNPGAAAYGYDIEVMRKLT